MSAWTQLRRKPYDETAAWDAFRAWLGPANLSRKERREREGAFFVAIVPLIGYVVRSRFRKKYGKDVPFDDLCSELYFKAIRKIERHSGRYFEVGDAQGFSRLLTVCLRNLIYDQIKTNRPREVHIDSLHRPPRLSVPKTVELKLAIEELPVQIAEYAAKRDRFGFGKDRILTACKIIVAGHALPTDMVRNWLRVDQAERFVAFVTLMSRIFLCKFRDKFATILTPEQREYVEVASGRAHLARVQNGTRAVLFS